LDLVFGPGPYLTTILALDRDIIVFDSRLGDDSSGRVWSAISRDSALVHTSSEDRVVSHSRFWIHTLLSDGGGTVQTRSVFQERPIRSLRETADGFESDGRPVLVRGDENPRKLYQMASWLTNFSVALGCEGQPMEETKLSPLCEWQHRTGRAAGTRVRDPR
jgi:hypothetical protein